MSKSSNKLRALLLLIILLIIPALACGAFDRAIQSESVQPSALVEAEVEESEAESSEPEAESSEPLAGSSEPEPTLEPTDEPLPTETPAPTATPAPTDTPEPPPSPTPASVGMSRANPSAITNIVNAPNWDIQVLDMLRGDEAWQAILAANQFNEPPLEGMEYLLLKIFVKSTHEDSESHFISSTDFSVTGDNFINYFTAFNVDPDPMLDAELFSGGETEGWASFQIAQDEGNLILIFDEFFSFEDDRYRYIALDDGASITVPSELAAIAPIPLGEDRTDPVPFGETAVTEDWEVTLLEVLRGDDAWTLVQNENQFNDPPEEGLEYIAVKVNVRKIGSDEEAYSVDSTSFQTTGDLNVIYDNPFVIDPIPALDAYLFPGGVAEGWITVQAAEGEGGVLLIFDPFFSFSEENKRFLSLE